jgi:hypothetical protein
MNLRLSKPFQLFHLTILRCAALLVPNPQREEWLKEWQSELWHVRQAYVPQHGISIQGERAIATFFFGAFQDSICVKQQARQHKAPIPIRGSAVHCALWLAAIAASTCCIALLLPGVRSALQPSPYRDARSLMLISDAKFAEASLGAFPTIRADQFRAWKDRRQHLFTDFAFYQTITEPVHTATHQSAQLAIVHSSANLLKVLGLTIQFAPQASATHANIPSLILTDHAWRKYFNEDPYITGSMIAVGQHQVKIVGILPSGSWRLPGRVDAWLLEPDENAALISDDTSGYLIGALATSPEHVQLGQRWHMSARIIDGTLDDFVCVSLAASMQEPFNIFLFATLLAFLSLPATTSVPLGEYPSRDYQTSRARRLRRWFFLCGKLALILPSIYFGSLDLAHLTTSIDPVSSEYIQLISTFCSFLFALRWILRDQRKRCPVCLRKLTNPARVGQPSRNFLSWNGTELICVGDHSWFSTQRWLYLDPSWEILFAETRLTPSLF